MRRHKMLQFCKYLSNFHEKLEHFKQKGKKRSARPGSRRHGIQRIENKSSQRLAKHCQVHKGFFGFFVGENKIAGFAKYCRVE